MAILSGDKTYVTVQKGDTLSEIARDYSAYSGGASWQQLAAINGIPNPDLISIGQTIRLTNGGGGVAPTPTPTTSAATKVTIKQFGLQSNADNVLFVTWKWDRSHTENYEVEWCYTTGDGVWFLGNRSTSDYKQSTYSIPSNAASVGVRIKPVSKTYQSNNKTTSYWTGAWSTRKVFYTKNLPPVTPSVPSVTVDEYKLVAEIENIVASDLHATGVQFQIVKNDKKVYKTGKATINTKTNYVSYSCTITAGSEYKVRCRSYKNNVYSDWSDYSSNVSTMPAASKGIKTLKALSETSVYIDWYNVSSATSYDVQYTTQTRYFDSAPNEVKTVSVDAVVGHAEITGMESGQKYYFRVRAVNDKGESGWTSVSSVVIGKDPAAPTTWSSSTTVVTGEDLILYWVHNSEDNSSQTFAELELIIDGIKTVKTIENSTDEELKDLTSSYPIKTKSYKEGTEIKWRVRTAGITKKYGDWSIQRVVTIYAPPTLEMTVSDVNGEAFEVLTGFPISIRAIPGPDTQIPTGYSLTVVSKETYETVDNVGNTVMVGKGETIYSKYFDIYGSVLNVRLSAGDLNLDNNIDYVINCVVSMNSGLTASASMDFSVAWKDETYVPNAEINFDPDTLVTHIRPYCVEYELITYEVTPQKQGYVKTSEVIKEGVYGEALAGIFTTTGEQVYSGTTTTGEVVFYCEVMNEKPVAGVTLSVYRREFDGGFVELATDLKNTNSKSTFITDPHPALDYARYRIVAITTDTGAVSYYDVPGYPIGESAIVIQWDEEWEYFDISSEDEMVEPPWSGSLLRLPYNVDISENSKPDVALVEYIGRSHPVSYYGTQVGQTATWNTEIVHDDEETLYALRRLQRWMGDVYVREPSGSGYWANITVSFSDKHCALTIPVTINITRVEGGM